MHDLDMDGWILFIGHTKKTMIIFFYLDLT